MSIRLKNLVILVPMRGELGKKKGYCNEQFKRSYTQMTEQSPNGVCVTNMFIYK